MKIGERLALLMEERGISEGELGRRSGVNQPTIHRIVTSESKNPRQDNIEKIAKALGVTSDWLWNGGEQKEPTVDDELKSTLNQSLLMFEELELMLHSPTEKKEGVPETAYLRNVTDKIKMEIEESNKRFKKTMDEFMSRAGAQAADFKFFEKVRRPRVLSILIKISQAAADDKLTDEDLDILQAVVDRLSR